MTYGCKIKCGALLLAIFMAGSWWKPAASSRANWRSKGEPCVQQWISLGCYNDDDDDDNQNPISI